MLVGQPGGPKRYVVDGWWQYDFNTPYNSVEMVCQNIVEIATTPKGSLCLFRDFGTSWDIIDQPGNLASYQAQVAVLQACAQWEPRVKFTKIILRPTSAQNNLAGIWDLYMEMDIDLSVAIQKALYAAPGPTSCWCVAGDFSSDALPEVRQITALM
jgi:phage baseplate assembly protein W